MTYGDKTAVDGLTLSVAEGSITAVLGPNGAGKTTTLETCEGYRKPQQGTVRVLGLDPIADRKQLLPRIGVMLQGQGAWSGVRAMEMLKHIARLHAHPLDVDYLAERLGLGECGRTPYRRLSGGQQQRLGLAMALVGRPELVFLDEPTAGMDPQSRRATWDLIGELRADGVAVLLTTHFMDEAERLADQVVIVDSGRVVGAGSPAELTAAGAGGQLRFTAVAGLPLDALRPCLPAGCTAVEERPGEYVITGAVTPRLLASVTAWCADHGALVAALRTGQRTLEDVFLDLTGHELRA